MKQEHNCYTFKENYNIEFENFDCGAELTVLFVHGFGSTPWKPRADYIKESCSEENLNFFRYELVGHGSDSAHFLKGDFNLWVEQILDIIDNKIFGKIMLIAHCLGSGIGMIAATKRPERIAGVITMALGLNLADMLACQMQVQDWQRLYQHRLIKVDKPPCRFVFTKDFIVSGLENHLSPQDLSKIACPVFMIHGTQDSVTPFQKVQKVAPLLGSQNVLIFIIEEGHFFRNQLSLQTVKTALKKMVFEIRKGAF